jgi:FAD:protein FMN transferase
MIKKIIFPAIILIAVVAASCLYESSGWEYQKISGNIQGTTYNITCQYKKGKDLKSEIEKLLRNFDLSLSTYEPESIISRINRNDPDVVPDYLFIKVFEESGVVHDATDGAFDITVAPLVNAWGFGSVPGADVDSALIDSLLQYVGMEKVTIKGNKLVKSNPGVMLDVNAIAQGYSVDVVASFLDDKKIENYLVEIGGELKCRGKNAKGENWKIGVDRPVEGNMIAGKELQAVLAVKTKSMATSGNYRRFYEKDGVKYAHSINPKTGYPVLSRLLSATVLADECITADAYATAFMVMGLEKSVTFLEQSDELEAYLVFSDEDGNFKVYATSGMKEYLIEERK